MEGLTLKFAFKAETKTCYRFETGDGPEKVTIYLKQAQVKKAGIDPKKGITVSVKQA